MGKGCWRVFCGRIDITKRSTKLNRDPYNSVEALWNEIIFSFAAKGRALVTIFTERDRYPVIRSPFSGCIVTGCRSELTFQPVQRNPKSYRFVSNRCSLIFGNDTRTIIHISSVTYSRKYVNSFSTISLFFWFRILSLQNILSRNVVNAYVFFP